MLTARQFTQGATDLATLSDIQDTPWQWVPCPGPLSEAMGEGYLSTSITTSTQSQPQPVYTTVEYHIIYSPSYRVPILYFRGSTQDGTPLDPLQILHHVDHLPVATHNTRNEHQNSNGTITADDKNIYDGGDNNDRQQPSKEPPMFSQEEHPFLKEPYYMIHPCRTGQVMELLISIETQQEEDEQGRTSSRAHKEKETGAVTTRQWQPVEYLLVWLCVVGSAVGLEVNAERYQTLLEQARERKDEVIQ